eukprot:6214219-Pleurochrysis_carterae.AAC.2
MCVLDCPRAPTSARARPLSRSSLCAHASTHACFSPRARPPLCPTSPLSPCMRIASCPHTSVRQGASAFVCAPPCARVSFYARTPYVARARPGRTLVVAYRLTFPCLPVHAYRLVYFPRPVGAYRLVLLKQWLVCVC